MATINATMNRKIGNSDDSVILITWVSLIAGSLDGAKVELPEWSDNCVQIVANTTGSATCVIQGSNDGTNWGTLYDAQGTALSFTATGAPKQIVERPRYIRPLLSGGGGTEDWSIFLVLHRSTPTRQ